jgi:hypothetical protein
MRRVLYAAGGAIAAPVVVVVMELVYLLLWGGYEPGPLMGGGVWTLLAVAVSPIVGAVYGWQAATNRERSKQAAEARAHRPVARCTSPGCNPGLILFDVDRHVAAHRERGQEARVEWTCDRCRITVDPDRPHAWTGHGT